MRHCTNCGAEVGAASYCPNCGAAQQQVAPPPPPGGAQQRSAVPYVIAAVAAVGIVVVGLIAFALLRSGGGEPVSTASTLPEPQVTVTRTASPTPTPTTASPTPITPSAPVTVTATTTATAVVPQAPVVTGGQTDCGRGVVAGTQTSCPFALRVADSFNATGGASYLYDVYSPVTGRTYDMYCNTSVYPVVCTGGDSAEVYIY